MATSIYRRRIGYVRDGEPVTGSVDSRPHRDAESNVDVIREHVELYQRGSMTVLLGATVSSACAVGMPVVFDGTEFVPAKIDPASSLFRADGVIRSKLTATSADITLSGYDDIDISGVADSTATGVYYLSPTAGQLTATPPAWAIPVLVKLSDTSVQVFGPSQAANGSSHEHRSVYLQHRRSDGDDAGWQEVSGQPGQPTGATYQYLNSTEVNQLAARHVPGLTWAVTQFDGYGRGAELDDTVVELNRYGLWWKGDFAPGEQNESASSAAGGPMRLRVSAFVSPYNTLSVVRSLVSEDPDGPLQVLNCDGSDEPTGDLKIRFDDTRAVAANDRPGFRAFKYYENGQVMAGPVLEGLIAGDSSILLTGTNARVDPDSETDLREMKVGVVEVRANINPDGRVIQPQTIRVDDLRQRAVDGVYYLAMPTDRTSTGTYKFRVPGADAVSGTPTLTLSVLLYAAGTGTLPALTVRYKRLPRPDNLDAETLPVSFTSLTFPASGVAVTAGDYVRVDSDPVAAVEADEVFVIEIGRSGPDGYAAEIGLLDLVCVLNTP